MSHGEASGVRLSVRAKPRASRSRIVRVEGLNVDVALAAPPVEGAANQELLAVLADVLGVSKSAVRLVLGASSKNKVVEVAGLGREDVLTRLAAALRA